jgi:hypothetical protein
MVHRRRTELPLSKFLYGRILFQIPIKANFFRKTRCGFLILIITGISIVTSMRAVATRQAEIAVMRFAS